MKPIDWVCIIAGALLLLPSGGSDGPSPAPVSSVLAECHAADVESKVGLVRQMARMDFESQEAAGDWWNEQSTGKRIEDFTPFTDELAVAMFADDRVAALNELADSLEGK